MALERFDSCKGCSSSTCMGNQPVVAAEKASNCSNGMKCKPRWENIIVGPREDRHYLGFATKPYPLDY